MFEFTSKQNHTLTMDLEGGGISFHYAARQRVYHVGQSWANVHALLAKLYTCQQYAARNRSLSVWMQDKELCLKFRASEQSLEEVCKFSPAETIRIMDFLGKAPNLN